MRTLIFLFLTTKIFAGVSLYKAPEEGKVEEKPQKRHVFDRNIASEPTKKEHKTSVFSAKKVVKTGNLPPHQIPKKPLKSYKGHSTYYPDKPSKVFLDGFHIGKEALVAFDRKLIGYPGSKVPVAAMLSMGKFSGSVLYGFSSMSKTTKRLLLNFTTLTTPDGEEYKINADLLSTDGTLGLVGEVYSNKAELFGLDLIFSAFKGYSEASKERETTAFGQEYARANQKNAEKSAVTEASQASINRIRNEFLETEEFVVSDSVKEAIIIFNEKPTKM